MIGTLQSFEMKLHSFGEQVSTIDGQKFLTWLDLCDQKRRQQQQRRKQQWQQDRRQRQRQPAQPYRHLHFFEEPLQ